MRVLDQRGIAYEAAVYDAGGAFHSGTEAASMLGVPAETVFKTLVVIRERGDARPLLVVVPVAERLDLRALGAAIDEKKLRMATQAEAERLTGLKVGGISPLAVRPGKFEVVVDERALARGRIHISGGERGVDIALRPHDLVAAVDARVISFAAGD